MSFENPNMEGAQKPVQENEDSVLTPKEKLAQLNTELKESYNKIRKLTTDFSNLSEEDYFESKEKLEEISDNIHNVKVEIQVIEEKIEKILEIQNNLFEN